MQKVNNRTYRHKKFQISRDKETGHWRATNPNGYYLATIEDLQEAMSYIEDAAYEDYSQWNEEAEIMRRMENPEISGR